MEQETRTLGTLVRNSPAFSVKASAPIHGDLYENNILVTAEKSWFLLDWDDLALGDLASDYAILLWGMLYNEKNSFPA